MNFWEIATSVYLLFGGLFSYYCYSTLTFTSKQKNNIFIVVITWPLFFIVYAIYSIAFLFVDKPQMSPKMSPQMSISQRFYEINKQNAQNSPHLQWIDYDSFIKK